MEIRVDTTLQTDVHVKNNRPDIFVLDKTKNEITLIEVGITSHAMLKQVEVEKLHKYDLLAGELSQIHGAKFIFTSDDAGSSLAGLLIGIYLSYFKTLIPNDTVHSKTMSVLLDAIYRAIPYAETEMLKSGTVEINAELKDARLEGIRKVFCRQKVVPDPSLICNAPTSNPVNSGSSNSSSNFVYSGSDTEDYLVEHDSSRVDEFVFVDKKRGHNPKHQKHL
ncbi:uncharacterized protein LOC115228190 [Octopus sinensis]|uniref:Uncharacterized protein LOC115228190 n=1 Tax=Octopus sinensis TaxID=2607531 RepID=A0A6P7TZJ9_9MOLL|nr:uncharacterized protein LOC115228190 [Octopus sinensis]